MQSATDAAAPDPSHANGHASAEVSDAAQLAPPPKNPLWKNESAVLSYVTTLIGGVHANVADQLDPSVLAQLSMTSLYAHIEEQLGAVAGVDYDKAWLRTKVDQIMFRNTTGASVVESSLEELPVRTPTSLAWGGGGEASGQSGGGGRDVIRVGPLRAGGGTGDGRRRRRRGVDRRLLRSTLGDILRCGGEVRGGGRHHGSDCRGHLGRSRDGGGGR